MRKSRTWLHAHNDDVIDLRSQDIANARLQLRLDRTPIAYIIGHKEFYTRLFKVTPSVLVPRPESESCITLLKQHIPKNATTLIDVGTGSGILGITAGLEIPRLSITLSDISRHALNVAEENAVDMKLTVTSIRSDLLASVPGRFDCIVANLPYVDPSWDRSPETAAEPPLALFADNGGLALIFRLLAQVPSHISPHGICVLEADPEQHVAIIAEAAKYSLQHVATDSYALLLKST